MENNKINKGLLAVIGITVFLIGFVLGMFVIHFAGKESATETAVETEEDPSTTINIEGEQIQVYVPKREVKYGVIPVNSYDQDKYVLSEDGYMSYLDEAGNTISHLGADISYHQKTINWSKLKESPVEFLMIRCGYRGYTEGKLVEDTKFREYSEAAVKAGYPIGVYFFTQALNVEEAVEEADYTMSLIEDLPISYPVAIDTEYVSDENARTNLNEITPQERSECVIAFCERIKEKGYYPIIYASENWLRRYLDASMLQEYEIWAPQYLDKNDFMYDFTIWQYTDAGSLPGIDGIVDLNISMIDYPSFVPSFREAYLNGGEIIEEQ